MTRKLMKGFGRSAIATLFAFIVLSIPWAYKVFIFPRPYWIHYYDPEMAYFYGSLSLLEDKMQIHVDHPGIPVQMIGACLLYLSGDGPLEVDHFRVTIYTTAIILTIITAFLLIYTLMRELPFSIQIAFLWTYFICPQAFEYNNILSPELFYFPAASLFLLAAWKGNWNQISTGRAFLMGLTIGLCCAIKYTFLGFLAALIISLLFIPHSTWRERIYLLFTGLSGSVLAFIAFTSVALPLFPKMIDVFWRFASHKGQIGTGSFGLTDLTTIVSNFRIAMMSGKGWHLWLMGSFILCGVGIWRKFHENNRIPNRIYFLALFITTAILSSYTLAALKDNMSLRYLLPTGIVGMLVFAFAMKLTPLLWLKKLQIPIIALSALLIFKHIYVDVYSHRHRIYQGYELHNKLIDTLKKLNNEIQHPTIIYSYRFPQPSYALRLCANDKQLQNIEIIFPYEGHYIPWQHKIILPSLSSSWDYFIIRNDHLRNMSESFGPVLANLGTYSVIGTGK